MRGHLAGFGEGVPQGAGHVGKLIAPVEDLDCGLPETAQLALQVLASALTRLETEIRRLEAEIGLRAKGDEAARRLMTIPAVGPPIATALAALAPPPRTFRRGRDFAAWLGLHAAPALHGRQAAPGRRHQDGRALAQAAADRRGQQRGAGGARKGAPAGSWLAGLLARKPPMLVRVALANSERRGATGSSPPRTARVVRALMARGEVYRAPAVAAQGAAAARAAARRRPKARYGATVVRRDQENQGATECL